MSSADIIFPQLKQFFNKFITTNCIKILDEEIGITIPYEEILFILHFFIDRFGSGIIIKGTSI